MKKRLNGEMRAILLGVVRQRCPHLEEWAVCADLTDAPVCVKDELRHALTDELCATGLNADSEPNLRGALLEDLIDWVSMFCR